ncbi:MAG TPA: NUDIX hydrolase, partial [Candidatus Saccharimonadales bacterium]|nr:NUDIX hydrolase [Candidatus Saccharimonadales bacterium]
IKPPEEGYPPIEYKLEIPRLALHVMWQSNHIEIPDGPWHITNHPNRQRPEVQHRIEPIATKERPMSTARQQHWDMLGLRKDTAGRPLHPRALQLLGTAGVGMFTGPGFHYTYGPQRMANLGAKRIRGNKTEYAVVRKHGKKDWSLPGGYAEPYHATIEDAAFHEGWQEAGLDRRQMGHVAMRTIFSPPKGFRRDTLHAWGEEYFTFVASYNNPALEGVELAVYDTKEIADARWMDLETIITTEDFVETHRKRTLEAEGVQA